VPCPISVGVIIKDLVALYCLKGSRCPKDGPAEALVQPEFLAMQIMDKIVWCIFHHGDLLEDDIFFLGKFIR
jgi:hypothetical protein